VEYLQIPEELRIPTLRLISNEQTRLDGLHDSRNPHHIPLGPTDAFHWVTISEDLLSMRPQ
ncbi:hypothetical protein PIB30_014171, partial [Stylosanthes scabra]|nr:hypothetical protein [Stylosanthes scabra]